MNAPRAIPRNTRDGRERERDREVRGGREREKEDDGRLLSQHISLSLSIAIFDRAFGTSTKARSVIIARKKAGATSHSQIFRRSLCSDFSLLTVSDSSFVFLNRRGPQSSSLPREKIHSNREIRERERISLL